MSMEMKCFHTPVTLPRKKERSMPVGYDRGWPSFSQVGLDVE